MSKEVFSWSEMNALLNELVEFHKAQLLKTGQRLIPHLTSDDVLQPNDFPELEFNPNFRYEEGIVAGIQSAQMALQAMRSEAQSSIY